MKTTNDNGKEFVFPNGFESWHETHFEIVQAITAKQNQNFKKHRDECEGLVFDAQEGQGFPALYTLAVHLTDEFEKIHEGREWDGEYFETIEEFINSKNL